MPIGEAILATLLIAVLFWDVLSTFLLLKTLPTTAAPEPRAISACGDAEHARGHAEPQLAAADFAFMRRGHEHGHAAAH